MICISEKDLCLNFQLKNDCLCFLIALTNATAFICKNMNCEQLRHTIYRTPAVCL